MYLNAQSSTFDFAKSLPNPKSTPKNWILDKSGILESTTSLVKLNQIIIDLEKETTIEIAIVILPSIGDLVPKNLATEIFNLWGIGKANKNNGILILHVLDQRRIEIETGYEIEGILPDVICKRLLEEKAIPYFKVGAFSTGFESLLISLTTILRNPNWSYSDFHLLITNLPDPNNAKVDKIPEILKRALDPTFESKQIWRFRSIYFFVPGLILYLLLRFLLYRFSSYFKTKYEYPYEREEALTKYNFLFHGFATILITVGLTGIVYSFFGMESIPFSIVLSLFFVGSITYVYATRMYDKWEKQIEFVPIHCSKCKSLAFEMKDKSRMVSLLSENESFERSLLTYKFNIFECNKCHHLETRRSPGSKYEDYSECQKCNCRSLKEENKVLKYATISDEGLSEVISECLKCGDSTQSQHKLPKLVSYRDTKSSNSSGSSSNSTSSNSNSSSSSSSSSKFGGGSSGGGGSGSSY